MKRNNLFYNIGFISKRKLAIEIARLYLSYPTGRVSEKEFLMNCGAQSSLNMLCQLLKIKPLHLNELGGGTGEMLRDMVREKIDDKN